MINLVITTTNYQICSQTNKAIIFNIVLMQEYATFVARNTKS